VSWLDGRDFEPTHREWEVLMQLGQGRSTAEIAEHLVITNGTVRTHVSALVHKVGVRDRDALAQSTCLRFASRS
jgi:DNA-binding NarL/FixJ family response regulator